MSETSYREIEKLLNSSDKSNQKKYCGTISVNREVASINTVQLHIGININGKKRNTIINSDVTENFIIKKYTKIKKYSTQNKK